MLGGVTAKSLTTGTVNLTASEVQNGMLRMTGALTGNIVIGPGPGVTMVGFYYWENLTSGAFSITLANAIGSVTLPQSRRGVVWVDATNGPRIMSIVGSSTADVVPAGYCMPFYNASVPPGWTGIALGADYVARLVTNGSGGTSGGSQTFSTVFGYTATGSTTLTLSQIPSHQHTYQDYYVANAGQGTTGGGGTSTGRSW
jgi:hypothetical protein